MRTHPCGGIGGVMVSTGKRVFWCQAVRNRDHDEPASHTKFSAEPIMGVQAASYECPSMQVNNAWQCGSGHRRVVAPRRDRSVADSDDEILYRATLINVAGQRNQFLPGLPVGRYRHLPRLYRRARRKRVHELLGLRVQHTHTCRRPPRDQQLAGPSVGVTGRRGRLGIRRRVRVGCVPVRRRCSG